jgi:hypothetical protein
VLLHPRRVVLVESPQAPHGAHQAATVLDSLGIDCRVIEPIDRYTLQTDTPDLVMNLIHPVDEAQLLALYLEARDIPFTGPSALGLARAASDWRRLLPDLDIVAPDLTIEGEDLAVELLGDDPMLIVPGPDAGDQLSPIELDPETSDPDTDQLNALVVPIRAALDLRDFALLEARINPSGHLWLDDVDPIPSLAPEALFFIPGQVRESWSYAFVIERIVLETWRRVGRATHPDLYR